MNLMVTGHHLDLTESLRDYVSIKIDRLERHSDDVQDVHVILSVEKLRKKAEATVKIKGNRLFADTTEEDMYAAIDLLTDKLDRQLIKHKEKIKDHHRKDKNSISTQPEDELHL